MSKLPWPSDGCQDSEQNLVDQLWDHLPADALLLEDRGFFSYRTLEKPDTRGTKAPRSSQEAT